MALRRRKWCPDAGNGDAVGIASPSRDMFEEWKRGGGGTRLLSRAVLYESGYSTYRTGMQNAVRFEQDPRGGNHYSIREICDRLQRHAKHFECGRSQGKWNLLVA